MKRFFEPETVVLIGVWDNVTREEVGLLWYASLQLDRLLCKGSVTKTHLTAITVWRQCMPSISTPI